MKNYSKILIPSILFILAIFIVGTNLSKPFWGEHDWNGARYGNIAKNYLRYGFLETKFGQVENGGVSDPADFIYYTHYQPLLPILISVSYKIGGISEFTTRIVPVIATAGFIVTLYFIGTFLLSWQMGLFASLLALATPMLRYYGGNPVHEPMALPFSSLAFLGVLKKNNKLLVAGIILTALTNWSFMFLAAGISMFWLSKKNIKKTIYLWILAVALMTLHFVHVKILSGSFTGGNLIGAFLERTSVDQVVAKFSLWEYILRIRLWSSTLFTNTLLVSSLLGLTLVIRTKLKIYKKFILAVSIYCLYPIFFANASFVHSYFIYYLTLPLSLLGGYLFAEFYRYKKAFLILFAIALLGVWFERNSYVSALNESNGDKLAVEIATRIKMETKPTDVILVKPFEYVQSRLPILSFYSDRNIILNGRGDWDIAVSGENYEISKETNK